MPGLAITHSGDGCRTHGDTYVFYVILNGVQHSVAFTKEEALENAAQLDYMYNSPELNDGIQGTNNIQLLTFAEMMESDVEMVI
jgi:hypothetical protein